MAEAPDAVPVQMTNIVPLRVVSVHGDFFDTELHLDAPLHVLQRAVEDCFKVRPELQLLTHNRQQIRPSLSLRRNGCLLLKGDPYVKIVLDVKKGTRLNIVCHMPHHEPVPLACAALDTVWETKKKFCAAVAKPDVTPQRIRLLWRYWELNDKATLDYYHLPTNAKLTVMRKRGFASRHQTVTTATSAAATVERTPAMASHSQSYSQSQSQQRAADSSEPLAAIGVPSAASWQAPAQQTGRAVIPIDPYGAPAPASQTVQWAMASEATSAAELTRLKQGIAALERRLEAYGNGDRSGYALLQESHRATLHRVSELEDTVGRFHHLLQRAIALL